MYNKKVLSTAKKELTKAKAPAKPKDIITDPMGQWKYPGLPTRIPSNDITMKGVGYPVLGVANNGQRKIMLPGADYTFPGADYVDEYPQMRKGGAKKKKTKSLSGTNKLMLTHPLLRNYKNKVYDPNVDYFQDGGMKTVKSKDGTVTNRFINEAGDEVVQVKTKDGKYSEKIIPNNKYISPLTGKPYVPRQGDATIPSGWEAEDNILEDISEFIDPTGITSWDDVARAYDENGLFDPKTGLEILGALPLVGKIGKSGKILAGGEKLFLDAVKYFGYNDKIANAYKAYRKLGGKNLDDVLGLTTKGLTKLSPKLNPEKWESSMKLINALNKFTEGAKATKLLPYSPSGDTQIKNDEDYIEAELTDDEIEEYRKGGYIVEDISVPELTQAQKGKFIAPPLPRDRTRSETTQRVSLPSRQAVLHVKNKPAADKALKKEKKEQQKFKEELWKKYKKLPLSEKISDRIGAFINDPLGMTSRALLGEQAYIPGMAQGLHDYENPEVREKYLKELGYTPGEFDASDIQNMINPGNWVTSITENTRKGDIGAAALDAGLMFLPHLPQGTISGSNIKSGAKLLADDIVNKTPLKNTYKILGKDTKFHNPGEKPHWFKGYTESWNPMEADLEPLADFRLNEAIKNLENKKIFKEHDAVNDKFLQILNDLSNEKEIALKANDKKAVSEINAKLDDVFNARLKEHNKIAQKHFQSKQHPFEEQIGAGGFGTVYGLPESEYVIKVGQIPKNENIFKLVENAKGINKPNIALPKRASTTSSGENVIVMNKVEPVQGNMFTTPPTKESYEQLIKDVEELQGKGIYLDFENPQNIQYNPKTGLFNIYDLNTTGHVLHKTLPKNSYKASEKTIEQLLIDNKKLPLDWNKKVSKQLSTLPNLNEEGIVKAGLDGNLLTRPLTLFTKNEMLGTPDKKMLYRKIGNAKGLQDLIEKQGAQAPKPMTMTSGATIDTPFFGAGTKPNENYGGLFAVEVDPSNPKYSWSNNVGGVSNYGVAPYNPETGELMKNIPLEDLNVYKKKWFSNNYKKLKPEELEAALMFAREQALIENAYKWGVRGAAADQIFNDGDYAKAIQNYFLGKPDTSRKKREETNDNYEKGGIVADLTPEEIQDYIAQGYAIEEVDEPELIEAQNGIISTKEHTDKKGNKTIKVQKEDGTVYTKVIGKDGKVYNRTFDPKKDSWATDQTKNLYSKAQGAGNSDWFWAPAALTAITAAPLVKSAATAVGEGIVAGGDAIANATLNKLGKNSFLRATKTAFNTAPSWLPSGATANNLLTAAGATYGTEEYFDKNSDVRKAYSKVAKDPTLRNIGDAVSETGLNILNFSGMNVGKNLKTLKNVKNIKLNLPEYKNYYRVEPTSFSKDPTDQLSGRWVGELEEMPFYIKNLKDPNSNVRVLRKKMKVSDWDKISGKNMPDEAKLMSIGTGEYNKYEDAATAGLIPQTVAKRIAKGVFLPSDIEQAASNKNLYNKREGILSDADINKVRTKKKVLPFSSWDRIEFSGDDKKSDAMHYLFSVGDKKNKLNKNILGVPRKYLPFKEGGVVAELSDDEIQDYINRGYVVEEVDEPKMQVGGESDLDSQIEAYKQKLELIKSRRAQNPIQETVVETPVKAAAVPVPSSNSTVQQVVVKQPVVKQSVVKETVKPKKENPIVKTFEKSKIKQEVRVKTEDTKQKLEKFTKDTLAKIKNQITPIAVPEPSIVNMYKNNYQKHLNSIITDPSKSKNLFNNNQLEKEIMDRQYLDNVRYGRFDKRGDDVMNRTDFKRNVDSEKYLADIAEDNSVIIDIGSALGNNDPKLSGVSVFELASNPKIKQKNVHVIATDIASGVKDFKTHVKNKTAYDIDYAEVPMNFKTPISKILKDKKLSDKENIYLRTANSIDLLMNVDQAKEHLNHIAKSLKEKTVTYLYNNVILYKPKGKTTFQKLGNINNAGYDHNNKSWLTNKNRTPYKLTKAPLR